MTRTGNHQSSSRKTPPPDHWLLRDAKARFSELVRRARNEGPQTVSVHGKDEVVVISADELRRLQGTQTGALLVAALRDIPYGDLDLEPAGTPAPVRDIDL